MNLSVTNLIQSYHAFDKEFWLSYKALLAVLNKEDFDKIKLNLLKSKKVDIRIIPESTISVYTEKRKLIEEEWKATADKEKLEGTKMHEYLHSLFFSSPSKLTEYSIPIELYLYMQNELFLNTAKGCFSEYRLESILDETYTLVGIADLILKDGNDITVIDYKTGKDISFKSRYDFGLKLNKVFKYPLNKYADAKGVLYQLLLSMYAYMIELMNPDFKIKDLFIYHIRNNKTNLIKVDYLKDSIKNLLDYHVKLLHLKSNLEKCNEINY